MEGQEKDYVEKDITDWRKSKFVAAEMMNQLNKQEEEHKRRPTRTDFRISKNQSFLLNTSFAPIKKPTATVETQTDETVDVKNYVENET